MYEDYWERTSFSTRLEPPSPFGVMIVSFEQAVDIRYADGYRLSTSGFVAGLGVQPVEVDSGGIGGGIQVNFTPLGMRRLFGIPMHELADRSHHIEDILGGAGARALAGRLEAAATSEERFDLLDATFLRALSKSEAVDGGTQHAWHRMTASRGLLGIGALADELEWDRRRLHLRFRDAIGLSPKAAGRVLRFNHAVDLLKQPGLGLARAAANAGYYDQAHMTREFTALAGRPPAAFRAALLPDGGGIPVD
jgi:AraC-like DNA-binding protein